MKKYIFALNHYNPHSRVRQDYPNGLHPKIYEEYIEFNKKFPEKNSRFPHKSHPYIQFQEWLLFSNTNESIIDYVDYKKVPAGERYFFTINICKQDIFRVWDKFEEPHRLTPYLDIPLDIPEQVLKDVRRNICKILFIYPNEGQGNWFQRQDFFYAQSKLLKVKLSSLIYVDANNINKKTYGEFGVSAYYYNGWEYYNKSLNPETKNKIINDIYNKKSRAKKFVNFNRRAHIHRIILVDKLLKAGLDKDMILTLSTNGYTGSIPWDPAPFNFFDFSELKNKLPITYDIQDLITNNPVDINFNAQTSAYIDITSETYCIPHSNSVNHSTIVPDHIFFSEKTFKPIICMQPFIQVNHAHSLKHLRELGYKTFHPFINEEYDDEVNNYTRVDRIFEEITRLSKLNDEQFGELLKSLLPTLIHNQETYAKNLNKKYGNELLEKIMQDWNKEPILMTETKRKINYMKKNIPFKVAMIGLGKLGKDCAEVMSVKHDVTGYDTSQNIVSNGVKVVRTLTEAVKDRDIIFVAVPTPHDPLYGGETPTSHLIPRDFDYSIVKDCLQKLHAVTTSDQLIVLISTVLPGTIRKQLIQYLPNRRFVYNPYLIAMGSVKEDMVNPEMLIIGTEDGNSNADSDELVDFYKTFIKEDTRIVQGTWDEAESIKIFYNTFISAKLSLVNMIQDVAEKNGNINVDVVTTALKESTYRIMGPAYMKAGMGDGGACHPRDNIALRYMAQELNLGYDLFGSIMQSREIQAKNLAERCLNYGKDVCIVGAAYKPAVPYTQGSYSYLVGYYVNQLGGWLSYYDPNTGDNTFERKAQVYLIGYWEKWIEDIVWPDNCTIIDPWRRFKTTNSTIKVIHYGNTR